MILTYDVSLGNTYCLEKMVVNIMKFLIKEG